MQIKTLWRAAIPLVVREAANPAITHLALHHQRHQRQTRPVAHGGLTISGYFDRPMGVGRAGLATLQAFQAAGFAPLRHDLEDPAPPPDSMQKGVWLIHANAPEALYAIRSASYARHQRAYRIGVWVYELPRAPRAWRAISQLFDEIWVPSHFVAHAMSDYPVPVHIMPHPVTSPDTSTEPKSAEAKSAEPKSAEPKSGPGPLTILAAGDLRSSADRKNLLGALAIYTTAFCAPSSEVQLCVKLTHGTHDPKIQASLMAAAGHRPDIHISNHTLSAAQMGALLAKAAIFLSPHRSEGFGLILAEAFLAGTPSLATGWSGNLDFMAGLDPLLINHTLIPVRDTAGIYKPRTGSVWAAPDIQDAAIKLRTLVNNAALRDNLAQQGARAVRQLNAQWSRPALLARSFAHYITE